MTDQTPANEPLDRYEARQQRREARRTALGDPSRGSTWIAGLILILLGVAFLMRNTGYFNFPLKNWWALFILIPAIGCFDTALRRYRDADNRLDRQARSTLLVGLVLTFVTVMFLFDISWTFFGPVLIILLGTGLILNATLN